MSAGVAQPGAAASAAPSPPLLLLARLRALPRRHLLLAALVPVLGFLWLPIVNGPGATAAPAVAADPAAAPAGETAPAAGSFGVAPLHEFERRLKRRTAPYEPRWRPVRDTVPLRAVEPAAPDAAADAPAPPDAALVPSAIVLSATAPPVVVVRGRTCRLGDEVAGAVLVDVGERHVVWRRDDRSFAVTLPDPAAGRVR